MRKLLTGTLVIAMAGLVPAIAQDGGDAPTVPQGTDGRSANASGGELFFLVEELRTEVRHLRGRLEETSHQLDRLNRQARERYVDLDERLVDLNSRLSELEESRESSSGNDSDDGNGDDGNGDDESDEGNDQDSDDSSTSYREPDEDEREAYASIQYLIQEEQDYDAAIDEIYTFLEEYPEGDLSVNAYYWLGEVYLSKGAHEQAQQAFTIVTSRHESHRKAPDALFKLAVAHDRAGNADKANKILDRLQERYPDSEAAALGSEYRKEMG
ncbi:MAG: tol-pal system protein YbgF [Pseudomonadota bacterium]